MLRISRTEVWSAEIDDAPGGLARTLKAIADYGADLDCVIARRMPEKAGKGVVFITPLKGKEQLENADQAGFHPTKSIATLKVEGMNRPGTGAQIARVIGDAGVSMHGLSAAVLGRRFVCYVGFDREEDLAKAESALRKAEKSKWPHWHNPFGKKAGGKPKVAA